MKKLTLTIAPAVFYLLISANQPSLAQQGNNYGLSRKQDAVSLPKSAVPFTKPVRKIKRAAETILKADKDNEFIITNGWELTSSSKKNSSGRVISRPGYNTANWYNASVPGTVLKTLVDQGVYPDPYYGLNNMAIPDTLCRMKWWYRTVFKVPKEDQNKTAWLILNGINYQAEVWLNGKSLGSVMGAFKRGVFNLSKYLNKTGQNALAVHILPPPNPGIPHEKSFIAGLGPNGGKLCLDGPTFISTEGWDWVPGIRDRNIGLWQDVRLKLTGQITINDPQIKTDLELPDTSKANITICSELFNSSDKPKTVTVEGKIGDVLVSREINMLPGERKKVVFSPDEFRQLKFSQPRLWWPNGYGNPELYTLELCVKSGQEIMDKKSVRFGIREFSYELTVDYPGSLGKRIEFNPLKDLRQGKPLFDNINKRRVLSETDVPRLRADADTTLLESIPEDGMGPFLVIKINGQRIFCRGGNWGMDDAMKNISRESLEPCFKLHKEANLNMVRNWTGENTEEVFYDLCDEYGMLVWNDFWMSTGGYNLEPIDSKLFLDNAGDVIKRCRNHPSIAVWCPRNEGYAPADIEEGLARLVASEDGTRYYQPNSRNMNMKTSGPWKYFRDPADYFRYEAMGFNSELGTPSVPSARSVRKMMPEEDQWPISDSWYYHDMHKGQKDYLKSIDSLYGAAADLDDFCKKAQMINFESHRAMFESWNSRLWNSASGLLLWMTHPAWPSFIWQIYSWDYETIGSYFGSKKACEPIHIQMNLDDNKVIVCNTTLKAVDQTIVNLKMYDLKGNIFFSKDTSVNLVPNGNTFVFQPELPESLPEHYLIRLMLSDRSGKIISQNDYWRNSGTNRNFLSFNELPKVRLSGSLVKLNESSKLNEIVFTVTNNTTTPAIAVKLNLADLKTGEIILPAYCSDSYFSLMPGETRQLTISCPADKKKNLRIMTDGYNIENAGIIDLMQELSQKL